MKDCQDTTRPVRERIIVFGMGEELAKNKELILKHFEIIGCTDSHKRPSDDWERACFITPDTLLEREFDRILICSSRYKDAIRVRLFKTGIKTEKMMFLDELNAREKAADSDLLFQDVVQDMDLYNAKNREKDFEIRENSLHLIENEKNCEAAEVATHYFAQDIWGARKIYENNPRDHYDIGSSLNGFIAHLLVFREVIYIDIRPLKQKIPGLRYLYGNAMDLENIKSGSVESLSSLSVIEHFDLGRYGDPIDPEGYRKGAENMQRILAVGGRLYLGVPVGPEDKCVFNAHRIFKIETVIKLFDKCVLKDIAIVEPEGAWAHSIQEEEYGNVKEFSCGLFEFEKAENVKKRGII